MAFQGDSIFWVEVEKIVPNPFQPRREFDEAKLKELAESVRMYGILQPLTVTRKEIQREDGAFYSEYELIAGERRLRASKLAGLVQVPVIIREGENNEQEKLELAIIENLQREDLNAVDRALAFRQLADTFGLSHAQVAGKVGRSREYVSNTLRLLLLPEYMLQSLKVGDISEGHARTLLMLNDKPEELDTVYREILLKKLSVREVERIARKIAHDKVRKKTWANTDPALIEIEKQFTESLGTRVQIAKTDYGGKISIDYFSEEDLQTLLGRLRKEQASMSAVGAVEAVSSELEEAGNDEHEILDKLSANTPLESVEEEVLPEEEQGNTFPATPSEIEEASQVAPAPAPASEPVSSFPTQPPTPPAPSSTPAAAQSYSEPEAPLSPAEEPAAAPEVASAPSVPTVDPDPAPSPEKEVALNEPDTAPTPTAAPEPEEKSAERTFLDPEKINQESSEKDESDLYGVRNFGV